MSVQKEKGFSHFLLGPGDEITFSPSNFKTMIKMSWKSLKVFLKHDISFLNDL